MLPLQDKTLALLIQLPPSLKIQEGSENLRQLIPELDNRFRYAVEVRDKSWFSDVTYNFFADNNLCLVCSQIDRYTNPSNSNYRFSVYQGLLVIEVYDRIEISKIRSRRRDGQK